MRNTARFSKPMKELKRGHYFVLGLLVALTVAAVSPSAPPVRLTVTGGLSITTNGMNNFTIDGTGAGGTNVARLLLEGP